MLFQNRKISQVTVGNCYIGTKPSECNDLPVWSRNIFIYSQHSEKSLVQLPVHSCLEQVSTIMRRLFEKPSPTTARLDETYLKDCWCCIWRGRWVTAEHTLLPCQRLGLLSEQHFWPLLAQTANDHCGNQDWRFHQKEMARTLLHKVIFYGAKISHMFLFTAFQISLFTWSHYQPSHMFTVSGFNMEKRTGYCTPEWPSTETQQACIFQNFFFLIISPAKLK